MRLIHAAMVAVAMTLPAQAQETERRLFVTGNGVLEIEPDIAVAQIGVVAEGEDASAAVESMSEAAASILAGLVEDGIDARDVQTGQLSLRPVYAEPDPESDLELAGPQISGYVAETMLSMTIRDLDRLGGILSRTIEEGGNRFEGLSWQLSDRGSAEDAALAAAVADAARKASVMAQAAGLSLDGVVELREGTAQITPPMPMMEARMAASDVPVARGTIDARATVSIIYSLSSP